MALVRPLPNKLLNSDIEEPIPLTIFPAPAAAWAVVNALFAALATPVAPTIVETLAMMFSTNGLAKRV